MRENGRSRALLFFPLFVVACSAATNGSTDGTADTDSSAASALRAKVTATTEAYEDFPNGQLPTPEVSWGNGSAQVVRRALGAAACNLGHVGVNADGVFGIAQPVGPGGGCAPGPENLGHALGGNAAQRDLPAAARAVTEPAIAQLSLRSRRLVNALSDLFAIYDINISEVLANAPDANVSLPPGAPTRVVLVSHRLAATGRELDLALKHLAKLEATPSEAQVRELGSLSAPLIKRIAGLVGRCNLAALNHRLEELRTEKTKMVSRVLTLTGQILAAEEAGDGARVAALQAEFEVLKQALAKLEVAIKGWLHVVEQCRAAEGSLIEDIKQREASEARLMAALEAAAAAMQSVRDAGLCLLCP